MQENRQEKSIIKQKILLYLAEKGISAYEFYKKTGVTRGILTQDNGISEDNLARFLVYAPDVNLDWLLRDKGDMLRTKGITDCVPADERHPLTDKNTENVPSGQEKNEVIYNSELISIVREQAEEIGRLKARIEELERRRGDNAGDAPSSSIVNVG